jgi:hypothetical protein
LRGSIGVPMVEAKIRPSPSSGTERPPFGVLSTPVLAGRGETGGGGPEVTDAAALGSSSRRIGATNAQG